MQRRRVFLEGSAEQERRRRRPPLPHPHPNEEAGLRAGVTDGLKKHLGHQVKASVLKYSQVLCLEKRGSREGGGWRWEAVAVGPQSDQDADAAAPAVPAQSRLRAGNLAERWGGPAEGLM